jgi:uncharacterized membrane protein/protein-disulfide isomerase
MEPHREKILRRQTLAAWMVSLLLLLGLFDSVYLLDVHVTHKTGSDVSGFCAISETVHCMEAVDSPQSSLFGFPVPFYAIAFYAAMFVLSLLAVARRRPGDPIWDLLVLGFVGGILYSFFLLYFLLFVLDAVCPACLVLDVVNVLGLVLCFVAAGTGPAAVFKRSFRSICSRAGAFPILIGLAVFAVVFGLSHLGQGMLEEVRKARLAQDKDVARGHRFHDPDCPCETILREPDGLLASAPLHGNPDAPVMILEFSNFQCPFCARLAETFKEILRERGNVVQVRFFHYPLSSECNPHVERPGNPLSCYASQAAVCAQEQGLFWELHDRMFAGIRQLSEEGIRAMAGSIGLDMASFEACLKSPHSLEFVRANARGGYQAMREAGMEGFGTPFFFINGMPVRGARPKEVIDGLVDAALETVGLEIHEHHPH